MADIFDVARLAEVSVTTVSRVLNNHPSVRSRTRRIVFQAMEELGYLPHAGARGLRMSQSSTIGFVVHDLRNPGAQSAIVGAAGVIRERGYSLLLCDSERDQSVQSANLKRLFERRVEGLIVNSVGECCPELELFTRAKIPVLLLGPYLDPAGVPKIYWDQRRDIRTCVEYLLSLGHKRIGFVTHKFPPYDVQREAHRGILSDLGLKYDSSLVAFVSSDDDCLHAISAMLTRSDRPTAVVSGRHTLAPYVLGAIRAAGLKVPRDLSFITMGDSPWASLASPPLTVVARDYFDSGRVAARYIFARLDGQEAEEWLPVTEPELIVRESCATPQDFRI